MREVVVDACVAVKWFVQEKDSPLALQLFDPGIRRIAPDFLLTELANAFWKSVRLGRMKAGTQSAALGSAAKFFWSLSAARSLVDDALDLATQIDHPVYDCLYVIASRRAKVSLVTTDTKLIAKLAGTPDAPNVILLSDWKP